MASTVPVTAARIPDRDRLLRDLLAAGLEAKPVGEVEIHVTCPDGRCDDALLHWAEELVMQVGDAFVPIKHEGVIYIRPPVG
jgi:hypothetical protein